MTEEGSVRDGERRVFRFAGLAFDVIPAKVGIQHSRGVGGARTAAGSRGYRIPAFRGDDTWRDRESTAK